MDESVTYLQGIYRAYYVAEEIWMNLSCICHEYLGNNKLWGEIFKSVTHRPGIYRAFYVVGKICESVTYLLELHRPY
jgi:hypothetical protein